MLIGRDLSEISGIRLDTTLGKWESKQAGSGLLYGPGALLGSPPACPCPLKAQTRPLLPLQELQPFHSANISKTCLCQQRRLTRQRGICEGKCLCFYFILLLSHFCNCNCTNRIGHLFPKKVQGLKTGILFTFPLWGQDFHYTKAPLLHTGSLQRSWKDWKMSPASFPCSGELPGTHRAGRRP